MLVRSRSAFAVGTTIIRPGDVFDDADPIVAGREHLFAPVADAAIETATARPGEKRSTVAPPAPPADDEVPTGSADKVLAWVGDDTDRAAKALAAEQAAKRPRKGLVDALTALTTPPAAEPATDGGEPPAGDDGAQGDPDA